MGVGVGLRLAATPGQAGRFELNPAKAAARPSRQACRDTLTGLLLSLHKKNPHRVRVLWVSERGDLNSRPLDPQSSALTGLRYVPIIKAA